MMKHTYCKCDRCGKEESMLSTTRLPSDYWAQFETIGPNAKIYDLCHECKLKIINLIETPTP